MKSRIVFMGTPEFAVASLGALLINGFDVVAVVTSPDKPAGRGRKMTKPAVKEFAEFNKLKVLQPESLRDQVFIDELNSLKPDIFIVVAFRMLPKEVWKIPFIGTFNLHASLLPQYRGAAPINHAIINGETVTGLTTFLIDDKIDTGNILLRQEVPVYSFENAGDLHDRLRKEGALLVIRTLNGLIGKELKPRSQDEFQKEGEILKPAPKISPEFCIIDWKKDAVAIHNFIRGLAPYPCARTVLKGVNQSLSIKIFESCPEIASHSSTPGTIFSDGKKFLKVACANGFLNINNLQPEGKKRMTTAEFLRGFRIEKFATII
jgi:methionyl-tRNA formyltransferase